MTRVINPLAVMRSTLEWIGYVTEMRYVFELNQFSPHEKTAVSYDKFFSGGIMTERIEIATNYMPPGSFGYLSE